MKIFVDADACPVKDAILRIARQMQHEVVFVVSTASYFERRGNAQHILVDSMPQAVDIAIINRISAGDVVVTQDYGLALLALGKRAQAISPHGKIFTDDNMDRLLLQREMHLAARKAGWRVKGPKKRSQADEDRFCQNFTRLLTASAQATSPESA